MRLIFAGTPDFSATSLEALLSSDHQVLAVLTQPDRPAGRGQKVQESPVKQCARAAQLPVLQPYSLKDPELVTGLAKWPSEVWVVVAYGMILPPALLTLAPFGAINVHASLLPRWRGAAPIQRALLAGDRETGISLMQMETGLDTGPVLLQHSCPIESRETGQSLHDRLAKLGAKTLIEGLDQLDYLQRHAQPQPIFGVTYADKIRKEEAEIHWESSATEIDRKIRTFVTGPVARTWSGEEMLRLWEAEIEEKPLSLRNDPPGTLCHLDHSGIKVVCGEGLLRVTSLQRAGGKILSAQEFLRGNAMKVGEKWGKV
ncbi:MAG: methionyl-tRNA formyltransferase [Ferrovum myxofaciens]|uniref:methionyl-tRNA formyltransferase n=1 Tax=Ferrovum myxofaciens TaxID=416213 RepID=UPI0023555BDF|nr:methionyl-tRNA formyltransferase [Ferrovum myxofaciens]QKE41301.1 MAG: methionyl-tRNA formyltransferase [Ferrovum myxofaciens]